MTMPDAGREEEIQRELASQAERKLLGEINSRIMPLDVGPEDARVEIDYSTFTGRHTGENVSRQFFVVQNREGKEVRIPVANLNSKWMEKEYRNTVGYKDLPIVRIWDNANAANADGLKAFEKQQLDRQAKSLEYERKTWKGEPGVIETQQRWVERARALLGL